MTSQSAKAAQFSALHIKGDPVVLFNIWDVGSAGAVIAAGAKALATGSAPVALANGFADGEQMPFEMALGNIARIVKATALPVSMDLEGGYGAAPDTIAANVARALGTGVVGFNFEDQIVGGKGLYPLDQQVARLKAVVNACKIAGVAAFVNARTDIFLKAAPDTHCEDMLSEAIARAAAFAKAGASGFFAPGLRDAEMIGRLCAQVELPVNIIALPGTPDSKTLAGLGVARISYGPVPYKHMVSWLENAAREALQ
ncbi:MAG: isocitrate lyase/phosphoenolpyruvate mutase family protein [Rhodobacteraceae bacterium]|nr:isocitrate lyase/phosphoenolpyruvate mutase family protein [Paracoccaceae bacterium]